MSQFHINKIAVIGLGLMGGSLAKGIRRRGMASQVMGYDANSESMAKAIELGVVDSVSQALRDVVAGADLIVLSVPILSTEDILLDLTKSLSPSAVITDVGSVKGCVSETIHKVLGSQFDRFVMGHPIAGSELSGVTASSEDLYVGHKVILTPESHTQPKSTALVAAMWESLGAVVELMGVQNHDEVLAATSHLPHLLAYSLVDTLAHNHDNKQIFNYAAGGFRDFTRIAASSPKMWHDIFLANREAVITALDLFTEDLAKLRKAVDTRDGSTMMGVFTRAKVARDHFSTILARRAYTVSMTNKQINYVIKPGGKLSGLLRVPGDKSISHRSIMLGSIANGVTEIKGFLEGEDSLATLQAFRDMGVVIEGPQDGKVTIHGVGLYGLQAPPGSVYLGNSGTSMRLLAGLMAGQEFDVEMVGDESLSSRPMGRVANPLRQMGAKISTAPDGRPPMKIDGGERLEGIAYSLPMASAQVKSCLLLAGLYATGSTRVTEPAPTRDHTERMLKGFGYDRLLVEGSTVTIKPGGKLQATNIDVPADISSAAFFIVAATIAPNSDIILEHVGINPTRVGVINILKLMGADIELLNIDEVGGEPVADIRVRSAQLRGINIPQEQVPLAIDEFPAIFIAASCADGVTVLTDAEELRVKESDRIQAMVDGLVELGVEISATSDGAVITGFGAAGSFGGGEIVTHHDHRIAMSFSIAALRSSDDIRILDCGNVATSFPGFVELAAKSGLNIEQA